MALQPKRRTAGNVAITAGGLLPRLFTLIRQLADGCFLLRCYPLSKIFLLGSLAPCVARTFLTSFHRHDKAACRDKDKDFNGSENEWI
jgi:hypothetical protein